MPGMQASAIHAHRLEVYLMPKPTIRELAIETRPDGVFRRAAIGGVKPKFRIRVAE